MKIFITGGPRNGTTLIMQLIVALGNNNAGANVRLGNCEDFNLRKVVDNIATSRFPLKSYQKKEKFDKYFKNILKKNNSSEIALKYPLLTHTPIIKVQEGKNYIEMNNNNIYKEFIESVTENFDLIFYCYRDPIAAANSELNFFKKKFNHHLDDIEKENFFKSYSNIHQQTSEYINNLFKENDLNCKIINLNFNNLVTDPSKFILDLSSNLNNKINPLLTKWIADFVRKNGKSKSTYQSTATFSVISKFFGQLNNLSYSDEFSDPDLPSPYRQKLEEMYSHLEKFKI